MKNKDSNSSTAKKNRLQTMQNSLPALTNKWRWEKLHLKKRTDLFSHTIALFSLSIAHNHGNPDHFALFVLGVHFDSFCSFDLLSETSAQRAVDTLLLSGDKSMHTCAFFSSASTAFISWRPYLCFYLLTTVTDHEMCSFASS